MKNKIVIVIFILSLGFSARAQNFVSNGDFETYSVCPNGTSSQSVMQIDYAVGWAQSTLSPDYFNACNNSGNSVHVPRNIFGYQKDCCGGNGYAGGYMLDKNDLNNSDRDYIYTKLTDTLTAGNKYLVSMYVNKCDGFDYAVATIGMLFTDTIISLTWPEGFIQATPQVKHTTLISDTSNWTLIQDTITATGNEIYLTIGNFNTSATCDSARIGGNGTFFGGAYYYIDGVSVYDVKTLGVNNIENKKPEVNIYPNPNSGNFTLQYNLKENTSLAITDVNGNLVSNYNLPATGSMQLKNDNLENGIYIYRVIGGNGIIKTGKIVVMK